MNDELFIPQKDAADVANEMARNTVLATGLIAIGAVMLSLYAVLSVKTAAQPAQPAQPAHAAHAAQAAAMTEQPPMLYTPQPFREQSARF